MPLSIITKYGYLFGKSKCKEISTQPISKFTPSPSNIRYITIHYYVSHQLNTKKLKISNKIALNN